jgi:hypothetical protein
MEDKRLVISSLYLLKISSFFAIIIFFVGCITPTQISRQKSTIDNPKWVEKTFYGGKYAGEWKDGKPNGQGTVTWPDGQKYVGGFKDGIMNGQGTVTWPNGTKYVGEFKNGKWNGQGAITSPGGSKYVGEWKDNNVDGQGTFTWSNGSEYVGEWKDNERNGQGTLTWSDGSEYVGEWKDNKRNGQGTLTWPDGSEYVGEWKDNNVDGHGTFTRSDGSEYVGEWKDNERNGRGTFTWSDGSEYVGEWKDNKRNGQGTLSWPDGSNYVGGFKDDKRNGQGTLTWSDSIEYVGGFKDDKMDGQGIVIWPSGNKYIGNFNNGESDDNGIYISSDGSKFVGKLRTSAKIVKVEKGSQGERMGLMVGDNIVEYYDVPILSGANFFRDVVSETKSQEEVKIEVLRNGKQKSFILKGGVIGIRVIDSPYLFKEDIEFAAVSNIEKLAGRNSIEKWAVIIGIAKYKYAEQNSLENLIFADDDANDFARVLRNLGWSEDHIKLLVNEEASRRNITIALESWLTKAGPQDQIVLFWSGHGFPDPENPEKVYFACYDTDISIPATGYRMDRVRLTLEETGAKNVFLFADTCHAGKLITRGNRDISIIPQIEEMNRKKNIPKGWIFLVGAETDRQAVEHTSWKNGAFTHSLLKGLMGEADGFQSAGAKDGIVTMGELKDYMNTTMPDETQKVLGVAKHPFITTSTGDPDIWNLSLHVE